MLDVWLPTRLVTVWCQERNMRLPQGLAALGPTRATAVDEVILQSPVNEREADLTPEDARATQARGPAHEGQDQRLWAPEDFARPSTRVQHLIEWACWKYKIQPKEDNQTVPGRDELLRDHQKTFGPIKGISEKTMRAVRDALTTEQQRRGGAPAHRGRK
jgi:phage/plasmid-associated DNA primase